MAAALARPTIPLLAAVVDGEQTLADGLAEAERTDIIRVTGDLIGFSHPLLASTIYDSVTAIGPPSTPHAAGGDRWWMPRNAHCIRLWAPPGRIRRWPRRSRPLLDRHSAAERSMPPRSSSNRR